MSSYITYGTGKGQSRPYGRERGPHTAQGAGAGAIPECHRLGIACLITGEFGHTDYHVIRELGDVAVIAAGHYKTEVPGVIAVLDLLKKQFDVACEFVDFPTGL